MIRNTDRFDPADPQTQPSPHEINGLLGLSSLRVSDSKHLDVSPEMRGKPTGIAIVNCETIFCDTLRMFLQMVPDFDVVAGCSNVEDALTAIQESTPDVLLLDSSMYRREPLDILEELNDVGFSGRVIVLCKIFTKDETRRALQLGARGIVLKTDPAESLIECIRHVVRGDYWLGQDSIANLVRAICENDDPKRAEKNKYGLTPREIAIVAAVLKGFSNPEIAANLSLSEQTVKHHLSHIFDKLGVYSRLEMALFVVNHGIDFD